MARKGLSPTQRTLRELRQQGRLCAIVERFNSFVGPFGIRQDAFGFIDVLSLDPARGIVAIQCCAGSGLSSHRTKIVEECREASEAWLQCCGKIEIWAWRKVKLKRGGKAERWQARVEEITTETLSCGGSATTAGRMRC